MTQSWTELYITDKSGGKHFKTLASPMGTTSEIKNLKRHIEQAKKYPEHYGFMDIDSAVLIENGSPHVEMTIEDILRELGE